MSDWIRSPRLEQVVSGLDAEVATARRAVAGPSVFLTLGLALGLFVSGGLLCGGFLAVLDEWLSLPRVHLARAAGLAGAVALVASTTLSWLRLPSVARPLLLVGAVVGRGLVAYAVSDRLGDPRWVMMGLEAVLLLVHRDPLQRWGATALLVAWLVGDRVERAQWVLPPVLAVGLSVSATRRWWAGTALAEVLTPFSGGLLGTALVLPCLGSEPWTWYVTGALGVSAAALAVTVASGVGVSVPDRVLVALLPLLLGAVTWGVPGVTVALLVGCTGFLVRSPVIWGSAVTALVGYAIWFYYDLDVPLYEKGGTMIALGVACCLAGWRAGARGATPDAPVDRRGWWLAAVGGALAVAAVWAQAGWQEVRLRDAEVVYLPLAPRDPRSLVQGDYQRLGYRLSRDLEQASPGADRGIAVLSVDADGVASFARLDDGSPVGPGEVRVRFTSDGRTPTVASRAWLFEEGTGDLYGEARYGIVAVPADGSAVLVGLADGQRTRLGPPRRLW